MAKRTLDMNILRVVATLVERVGMHDLVLVLAAVAHTKSVTGLATDRRLAREWEAVALDLKLFAQRRLQGLR
jgi:hypothetical protein